MDRELSFKATTGETIRVKWGAAEDPTDQDLADIEQAWYSSHPRPKAQAQAQPRPLQGSLNAPVPVDPFRDGMKVQKAPQTAQPPKAIPAGFGVIGGQDLLPEARDKKPAPKQESRDAVARRATADSINPKKIAAKVSADAADTAKREREARGFWRDVAMQRDAKAGAVKQTDPGYVGSEAQDMEARGEFGTAHWKRVAGENLDRTLNPVASELARRVGGNLQAQKDIYKGVKDASAKLGILDPLAALSLSPENIVMGAAMGAGGKLLHGAFGNPAIFGKLTGMVGKGADELAAAGRIAEGADQFAKSNADRQLEGHVATALRQALGEDAPQFDLPAHGDLVSPGEMPNATFRKRAQRRDYAAEEARLALAEQSPIHPDDPARFASPSDYLRHIIDATIGRDAYRAMSSAEKDAFARPIVAKWEPSVAERLRSGDLRGLNIDYLTRHYPSLYEIVSQMDEPKFHVSDPIPEARATGQAVPEKGLEPQAAPKAPEPSQTPKAGPKEPWQMTQRDVIAEGGRIRTLHAKNNDPVIVVRKSNGEVVSEIQRNQARSLKPEFEARELGGGPFRGERDPVLDDGWVGNVTQRHKQDVDQALKDGKPVPPEVLADYPDLAAKYGKAEPPKPLQTTTPKAEAKVVYHGTGNIDSIRSKGFTYEYSGQGNEQYGPGFYFTNDLNTAKGYTTARIGEGVEKLGGESAPGVVHATIDLKNPIIVDATDESRNARDAFPALTKPHATKIVDEAIRLNPSVMDDWGDVSYEGKQAVRQKMIDAYTGGPGSTALYDLFDRKNMEQGLRLYSKLTGHDGVVVHFGNQDHTIAWFPEQIKDAPKPTGPTLSDAVANPAGKAQGVTPESFTRKPLETKAPKAEAVIPSPKMSQRPWEKVRPHVERSLQSKGIRGDRLANAMDLADELASKQAEIGVDGYVTLYHRTTPQNAESIVRTGKMTGKEDRLFFGTHPEGQIEGYGDAVIKVRLPIQSLELNDIFSGEAHVTHKLGGSLRVDASIWHPPKPAGPTLSEAVGASRATGAETRRVAAEDFKPKPTEPMQGPSQATGLANQQQDREALQGILDKVEPAKGKGAKDWHEIGKKKVESGEINPYQLAEDVGNGDVELTGERVGALLEGKRRLELDVNNAKPGAEYEAAKQRLQDYVEQVQQGKGRWSDVGRALQAGTTVDEGNFAQVIEHARRSGAELNPDQEEQLRELSKQVKEKDEQLAAAQKIIEDQQASMTAQNVARAARRLKTGDVQKARDAARARFVKASAANTFVNDEQMAAWWDLAKTYVQKGDTPDSLIERIRKDLGDQLPDYITDADMKAAMALGGKPQQAAKRARTEIEKEIAKLRREAKVQTGVRDSELIPQIQKRIADLQDQLDTGQYRLPKARAAMYGPEVEKLQAQRDVLAARVRANIETAKPKTLGQKVGSVLSIPKNLRAAIDLSAGGRQGWLLSLANPEKVPAAFGSQIKAMLSEEGAAKAGRQIASRPNAVNGVYKRAGLEMTDYATGLGKHEEVFASNLLDRWTKGNPFRASDRAYSGYLNRIRADVFDKMAAALGDSPKPDDLKAIANYINVATGRQKYANQKVEGLIQGLGSVMWAPRLAASRMEYLAGKPLYSGGSAKAKALIAKEYGKVLAGTAAMLGLAKAGGADVELDPRSSDFLKIKVGNTRIDAIAGLGQTAVLMGRLVSGESKTLSGKVRKVGEYNSPADTGELLQRYTRSKLNPVVGAVWDARDKTDYVGQKVTPGSVAKNLLGPLSATDLVEGLMKDGWHEDDAIGLLNFFGIGVNTYDKRSP